jgi:hypothetical protein
MGTQQLKEFKLLNKENEPLQRALSERRDCRVLDQHGFTQCRLPQRRANEERLIADMIELTHQYGRYC